MYNQQLDNLETMRLEDKHSRDREFYDFTMLMEERQTEELERERNERRLRDMEDVLG
jgi:hypothetical protein